jgi:TolA-binding protein
MISDPKVTAALEPAWSELREQRLLGRVVEARRQQAYRRRRRAALAIGTLFLAGAAGAAVLGVRRADELAARRAAANAPRLTLADGSEATLTASGNVQIEEQTPARVRLRQRAGAARYVVTHDPERDFVVAAGDVTVHVRGTIFSVVMRGGEVAVSVERGRVEVSDPRRTRELVAGESLTVPAGAEAAAPRVAEPPEPEPPAPEPASPRADLARPALPPLRSRDSGTELLARADAARAAGRSAEAARALETFVADHPRDARGPAALFTLGRVEEARGHWQAAAEAFDRCAAARADGPLADDALAAGAQAWHAAGVVDRARADARASLAAQPRGLHAGAMRRLAAP